ncbi:sugar phosphate isomerase/epimerase family protein [Cohaesibacter celericrescens]|uniref:sugar phosphate isomerase/epimerase family protein n=1 Tax=Cohaesibacter celericrescens TaxID=2067669 RepID=UPI003565968C
MSTLPILGAALSYKDVVSLKDWIFEKNRTLELQDFSRVDVLDDDQDALIDAYAQLLDGFGGVFGIHGPFLGLDLGSPDPLVQNVVMVRLLDAINKCERLGATHMVVHSPFNMFHTLNSMTFPSMRDEMIEAAANTLAPVLNRAEQIGCCLMLENVADSDPSLRNSLVKAIKSPMLKVSIDTGHAHFAHGQFKAPPVADFIYTAGSLLGHVHLQDADGYADRHWHPGEGTVPWGGVFKALADISATPRLILEVRDRKEQLPQTVARLQSLGLAQ